MKFRLLIINPGSTSTKIAVFDNTKELFNETIRHEGSEIEKFSRIIDQYKYRLKTIENSLRIRQIFIGSLNAIVSRGGLLKPLKGGVWKITEKMVSDLKKGERGEHASNLGAIIAFHIGSSLNIPSFVVDPVVVDEMDDIARLSGMPELERISIFHALNQKATALRASKELGEKYSEVTLIVAHLGGGISVGIHKKGRVVDVNNALSGEGPFSPERSGTVPSGPLVKLCFSGKYSEAEIMKKIKGLGGLRAYLGTSDGRKVEEMVERGDEKAIRILAAMAYQISKEIASLSAAAYGKIDGIILTGGLVYNKKFTAEIVKRISFLGRIFIYPGEDEISALRDGGLRVLEGREEAKDYI